jgi:hypothetical protein
MPAILPEMRCNPVGAGCDRQMRGTQRVGVPAAAGVPDGGDVIDIHAETKMAGILALSHEERALRCRA